MEVSSNVIFIALDTLRADHVGCYGDHLNTTPNIDKFVEDAVLFEDCIAPGIPTHPGYTTMFTGMHPLRHEIVCHGGSHILSRDIPMLSETLYEEKVMTMAVDNLVATRGFWLSRGYEYYVFSGGSKVISGGYKVSGEVTTEKALAFLKLWKEGRLGSKPFFMFIHYWDSHAPYIPPPPFRGTFYKSGKPVKPLKPLMEKTLWGRRLLRGWVGEIIEEDIDDKGYVDCLYDDEILYADHQVSRVLECLKDLGIYDNSIIVITADHGELLGEHDIFYDHHGLYEGDVHVPLIIKAPNLPSGVRVKGLVTHEDITPTILELLGVRPEARFDGKPLTGMIEKGGGIRDFVVCVENTRMTKRAIRTLEWKLIQTIRPDVYGNPAGHLELYNLKKDPKEKENLADSEENALKDLLFKLENWYRRKIEGKPDPLTVQPISLPIQPL